MARPPRRSPQPSGSLNLFDRLVWEFHQGFFIRLWPLNIACGVLAYALGMFIFGHQLGVSANYLVIIPVVAFALSFGFYGGLFSGVLGLPANLLCFFLMGRLDYAPASWAIAEVSGLAIGAVMGYLGDYVRKLQTEVSRRSAIEGQLRRAVEEKDALLRELNHRVKNNLNVITSLIKLQLGRSSDLGLASELKQLLNRVFSISLVQNMLYGSPTLSRVRPAAYLRELVDNIFLAYSDRRIVVEYDLDDAGLAIASDMAITMGLIVNEVVTNSIKHAFKGTLLPRLEIRLKVETGSFRLTVEDNGLGLPEDQGQTGRGLGFKLIDTLSRQLGASYRLNSEVGTCFEMLFSCVSDASWRPQEILEDAYRRAMGNSDLPGARH